MYSIALRLFLFLLFSGSMVGSLFADASARDYLDKGWKELIRDEDALALQHFGIAYEMAYQQHDHRTMADALLDMGICTYGSSTSSGLQYALKALDEYARVEKQDTLAGKEGKYRCLQLISTIYSRQGKYRESIFISHRVLKGLHTARDTTGTYGLALSSIGSNYALLGTKDSSEWYHQQALEYYLTTGNSTYLPGAYVKLGSLLLEEGSLQRSRDYFDRALHIADSTGNRQGSVMALNSLGDWELKTGNTSNAESHYLHAREIANGLSDKIFLLSTLKKLTAFYKHIHRERNALACSEEVQHVKDSLAGFERDQLVRNFEAQVEITEKTRQLEIAEKEQKLTRWKNYFLYGILGITLLAAFVAVYYQRRIHRRDRELRIKKEEIQQVTIEQQHLRDIQLRNEIDYKESQLSALTLQMLQKNELLQELREKLENGSKDQELSRVVNKGFNQDRDWEDFNLHFESINRNFYTRLREAFPDISPNDLKICALIKLNLSIKEMASILNISPDSVKTARYRLRKKLQLNTEDNLTEFIQGIS